MYRISERGAGLILIALVYLIAAGTGICIYLALPYAFWLSLLLADIAATGIVFIFSLLFHNASVYDPYWSVQPVVIVTAAAVLRDATPVALLLLVTIWIWGIRLTANWIHTFRGLKHQDWRYTLLQETSGRFYPLVNFFGIHLVPTLVVYGCVLPAVFVFHDASPWNAVSLMFCLLSAGAVTLQGMADWQMHRFRRRGTGGLIREGLWKYARHPNYLGEILMWWGIALAAMTAVPGCWYLCAGALANTMLFLFISIPMAEKRQSVKPGYAAYRQQTRMLLPIPKRVRVPQELSQQQGG